jgi:tetratricopeptide (TPR) repeat protein
MSTPDQSNSDGNSVAVGGHLTGQVVMAQRIEGGIQVYSAPPGAPPPPAQLPPPAPIVNRISELGTLQGLLDKQGTVSQLAVITGPPGIGKTALAVHWAHRIRPQFPDGQLYANLAGECAAGVLPLFLRALGVHAEHVPPQLAAQCALYRSATADRAVLVVLDEATDLDTIEALRPASPHSLVLVTSRHTMPGAVPRGAELVRLPPLRPEASTDLLTAVLGQRISTDPDATTRIVQLCDGVPLALHLVAAHLAVHTTRPPAAIADQLAADYARLDQTTTQTRSIEGALHVSYRNLTSAASRLHRLATQHEGPDFTAAVAAAAADISTTTAQQLLDELVLANLLEEHNNRYRYLGPVQAAAAGARSAQDDSEPERNAAAIRIITCLLDQAVPNDYAIIPARPRSGARYRTYQSPEVAPQCTRTEALAWFEVEQPNLLAAQQTARTLGRDDLVWQLTECLWGFYLYRRGWLTNWISSHELGVEAAHRCGNHVAEIRLTCMLVHALLIGGAPTAAAPHAHRALDMANLFDDHRTRATAHSAVAKCARELGDLSQAEVMFRGAIAHDHLAGNRRGAALHERRLGEVLAALGRHEEAVFVLCSAVHGMLDIDQFVEAARCRTYLGQVYIQIGQWDEAKHELDQALPVMLQSGSAQYRADVQDALGRVAFHVGDRAIAAALLEQALEGYTIAGDDHGCDRVRRLRAQLTV